MRWTAPCLRLSARCRISLTASLPRNRSLKESVEALFLPGGRGRRFCLLHRPADNAMVRGSVIYFPPFAEEMNKSRRMAALQARSLAKEGWFVLQPDFYGCGDSEGELAESDWDLWISDSVNAAKWLKDLSGSPPVAWGLRAGCMVAAAVASQLNDMSNLIFWHPVISGKQHVQQFLRMKVASEILGVSGQSGGGIKQLHEELLRGNSLEVAGYR